MKNYPNGELQCHEDLTCRYKCDNGFRLSDTLLQDTKCTLTTKTSRTSPHPVCQGRFYITTTYYLYIFHYYVRLIYYFQN